MEEHARARGWWPRSLHWRWPPWRPAGPPPRETRDWIHPSELPNFDRIPAYDATSPPRRRRPAAIVAVCLALVIAALGSLTLFNYVRSPSPTTGLVNFAKSVRELPNYAQRAAESAIEVVWTYNGHLTTAPALVIAPGNLAITTVPIPAGASLTGSSQLSANFSVQVVSHDDALGFSILRLGRTQPVTPTNTLPASQAVLAIAPYFSPGSANPEIAWALTVLGDPLIEEARGVVSYLATQSNPQLKDFSGAVAVEQNGDVVAVLSATGQWFSAQYVTRVAQVENSDDGCHGRLGVTANSAQGGGVVVVSVLHGPSWGRLRAGDILTTINGVTLQSIDSLRQFLYATPADHWAKLGLLRGSRSMSVNVRLGCQP